METVVASFPQTQKLCHLELCQISFVEASIKNITSTKVDEKF